MSLEKAWRAQAASIRKKAQPLVMRADEIKAKLKRASEYEAEELLVELSQLTRQIGKLAKEAANADSQARGDVSGLR